MQQENEEERDYTTVSIREQFLSIVFMFIGLFGLVGVLLNIFMSEGNLIFTLIMAVVPISCGILGVYFWKENR